MRGSAKPLIKLPRISSNSPIPACLFGEVDEGETLKEAALRELKEEIEFDVPADTVLRPLCVFQTRPVRLKSHLMHTFVALEEENEWIASLDVSRLNSLLGEKRERFKVLVEQGGYFDLGNDQKLEHSPEVHKVSWLSLRDAVFYSLSSLIPGVYNSDYQQHMFRSLNIPRRDPMWITAASLMELEAHPTPSSVIAASCGMDMQALGKERQWLHSGMSDEDVQTAFVRRKQPRADGVPAKTSLRTLQDIERLRGERKSSSL